MKIVTLSSIVQWISIFQGGYIQKLSKFQFDVNTIVPQSDPVSHMHAGACISDDT